MIVNFIASTNVHRYVIDSSSADNLVITFSGYQWVFAGGVAEIHTTNEMRAFDFGHPVVQIIVAILLDVECVP